jgi:hypothetical protein
MHRFFPVYGHSQPLKTGELFTHASTNRLQNYIRHRTEMGGNSFSSLMHKILSFSIDNAFDTLGQTFLDE